MTHRPADRHRDAFEATLATLRADLDQRAERDEGFWLAQQRTIRQALPDRPIAARHARTGWLVATMAATLLVALAVGHTSVLPPFSVVGDMPPSLDPATTELLRSVETTLASGPARSLSAADLLLAELEQEYAAATDLP